MTGCKEIRPLISSFVDGEASSSEIALVQTHLKTCDKCQSHLAFLKLLGPAISHAPMAAPSPMLFERIAKATYDKPTWQQRYLGWLAPLPLRWTVSTGLVAAGVVAVLVAPRLIPMASNTPEVTPIAANKSASMAGPATGTIKSAPVPVSPDIVRPSVTLPTPAPVAVKVVEPGTTIRTLPSVALESPAKRVAVAPRVTTSAKPRVETTKPAKSVGTFVANNANIGGNVTKPVVKPSPIPSPPKTNVDEPIVIAATPNRDSAATNPSTTVAKTVTIAANSLEPAIPSFTASSSTGTEEGGRKSASISFKGMNTKRPSEVADLNLRNMMARSSGIVPIAEAEVR